MRPVDRPVSLPLIGKGGDNESVAAAVVAVVGLAVLVFSVGCCCCCCCCACCVTSMLGSRVSGCDGGCEDGSIDCKCAFFLH